MAAKNTQERVERERLRAYRARRHVHEHKERRRVRDNWIAGAVLVLVLVIATVVQIAYFSAGPGAPVEAEATETPAATAAEGENQGDVPAPELAEDRTWTGVLSLNDDVELAVELDGAAAPQAVASEVSLIQAGFYDGVSCHRLTDGTIWVLQCGDPIGDGTGGPGYSYGPIENAPEDDLYPAGTIAMARQSFDAYSHGSQFFIVYEDTTLTPDEAGGYTVIGQVTDGLDDLRASITDAGVEGGATDGAPAVPTTITAFTIE
ncbi:hypothetical protein ARHIZOSPH14_30280 [Agromyces rhizosphaerae]|uniref:peptidylprolyl isomerase n=1 Tax=Agromyces rhizosphaerae TaxID=88374 RepID=A0A9W6FQQ0_9MICO|nr:peptidylprolyl isomerase [Agromyces rhizosphaerae]GLI28786.1 hypothetical protein ARHIZOSPH14_30280 [Agromyces rhizosphaerae]